MPKLEVRITQSDEIITVTPTQVPVLLDSKYNYPSEITMIIANFLRGGSPAVQCIFQTGHLQPEEVLGMLKLLKLDENDTEEFAWRWDKSETVVTFTRKIK
jgi:hypothetical protein